MGDFGFSDFAQDLDHLAFQFGVRRNRGDFARIIGAQGAVEVIEIETSPIDTTLVHPMAADNGLGRFAEIAAGLNWDDEPMFDFFEFSRDGSSRVRCGFHVLIREV